MTEAAAATAIGCEACDPEALFTANMAAFERWAPKQHRVLAAMQGTETRVVRSAGGLNIDLGHTVLYEPDAETFAREQVEAFIERPIRFTFDPPVYPDPVQYLNQRVAGAVYDHFGKTKETTTLNYAPQEHNGFLVSLGVGLGLHLPMLLDQTHFRNLILIEQHWEFIYHSLRHIDWVRLFETLDERNGAIHFFVENDPELLSAILYRSLRGGQFALIDGAYMYRHYSSFVLDTTHSRFVETLPTLPYSKGYFEDELVMMTNCLGNLLKHDFGLLETLRRVEKPVPAFIVGSGPSIDASVEVIRKFRDRVVVFSGGTGLRVLLKAGIKPDFHCEIENGKAVFEALSLVRDQFDFTGITLIGSTTVDPRVPTLFDDRILYFRDGMSSSELLAGTFNELQGSGPTVTNLGCRAAIAFGFTELYLFGVDMGARDPQVHHSKETIYSINEKWKKYLSAAGEPMRRPVPGNFGGTVYTNGLLLWSRFHMSTLLEAFRGSRFYNCSDGASISGTLPKLPKRVDIKATPEQRAATLRRMATEISYHKAASSITREMLVEAATIFDTSYDRIITIAREARLEGVDFLAFYDRLLPHLAGGDTRGPVSSFSVQVIGTITMMLQIGYYFVRRIDRDQRDQLLQVYLEEFEETCRLMREGAADMFRGFLDQYDAAHAV